MRHRFHLIVLAVAIALLAASCSSTTVVGRGERASSATSPDTTEADSGDPDDPNVDVDLKDAGYGLSGPEQISTLTADCEDGDDRACDILFQVSDGDSVEETIALSCAGRGDGATLFCTEGIVADENDSVYFDVDSPALDELSSDCEDGDMTACDFLYFRSPVGSSFEEMGNTCAGRTAVAIPDCRTSFPDS